VADDRSRSTSRAGGRRSLISAWAGLTRRGGTLTLGQTEVFAEIPCEESWTPTHSTMMTSMAKGCRLAEELPNSQAFDHSGQMAFRSLDCPQATCAVPPHSKRVSAGVPVKHTPHVQRVSTLPRS
jgi:hypothetical protein